MLKLLLELGPYVWAGTLAAILAILAWLVCRWLNARTGVTVAVTLVAAVAGAVTGYFLLMGILMTV